MFRTIIILLTVVIFSREGIASDRLVDSDSASHPGNRSRSSFSTQSSSSLDLYGGDTKDPATGLTGLSATSDSSQKLTINVTEETTVPSDSGSLTPDKSVASTASTKASTPVNLVESTQGPKNFSTFPLASSSSNSSSVAQKAGKDDQVNENLNVSSSDSVSSVSAPHSVSSDNNTQTQGSESTPTPLLTQSTPPSSRVSTKDTDKKEK